MVKQCPHCNKDLNLNESQQAKVESALAGLQPGGVLKIACPQCHKPIELGADVDGTVSQRKKGLPKQKKSNLSPPKPQDIKWLLSADIKESDEIKDIPMALILMPDGPVRDAVSAAFVEMFYQPIIADSPQDAIERMRFVNFAATVYHVDFEGVPLEQSLFHSHIRTMSMSKRRYMQYVLVGPEFNTLFDLEALTHSVNMVVNDKDVDNLKLFLKKGETDYKSLFGQWVAMLKGHGNV